MNLYNISSNLFVKSESIHPGFLKIVAMNLTYQALPTVIVRVHSTVATILGQPQEFELSVGETKTFLIPYHSSQDTKGVLHVSMLDDRFRVQSEEIVLLSARNPFDDGIFERFLQTETILLRQPLTRTLSIALPSLIYELNTTHKYQFQLLGHDYVSWDPFLILSLPTPNTKISNDNTPNKTIFLYAVDQLVIEKLYRTIQIILDRPSPETMLPHYYFKLGIMLTTLDNYLNIEWRLSDIQRLIAEIFQMLRAIHAPTIYAEEILNVLHDVNRIEELLDPQWSKIHGNLEKMQNLLSGV